MYLSMLHHLFPFVVVCLKLPVLLKGDNFEPVFLRSTVIEENVHYVLINITIGKRKMQMAGCCGGRNLYWRLNKGWLWKWIGDLSQRGGGDDER